jgi:hypothetical protein
MNLKVFVKDNQIGIKEHVKRDMRYSNAKTGGLRFQVPFLYY